MEKRWKRSKAAPYLLVLPLVIMLAILIAALVNGFLQSLGYIPGYDMHEISTEYYSMVAHDSQFPKEAAKSLGISAISAILTTVLSVVLGWSLTTVFKAKGLLNNISKLPMLIPYSVCALLIIFMFAQSGFLPRILVALGFENAQEWFSKILYWPNSIGVILVFVFHAASFFTYMIVGTMSQISDTLGEAALNLGSSRIKTFTSVVLPHCMPIIRTTFIFVFVIFFGSYEVPLLVGSATEKFLSVQSYLDYINFNFTVYRPRAMVLNMFMLAVAVIIVLAIYLWDVHDRKKRGVM